MDETTATIKYGCRLARDLEENLTSMANQPELLSRSCDEIIRVFSHVKQRISLAIMVLGVGHQHEQSQPQLEIASGVPQPMDQLLCAQAQLLGSRVAFDDVLGRVLPEPAAGGKMKEIIDQQQQAGGFEDAQGSKRSRVEVQPMEVSNVSRGSSSSQRQRRRRDEGEKRTVTVPAPQMGNTEIPPEDGCTWRKYGQKDILRSRFPRSYFRCTHQKLYKCPAKKLVQRLDDDPNMFEVTYRGEHTCHLSSTAPSVPAPSLQISQDRIPQAATILQPPPPPPPPLPSTSVPFSQWLSMSMDIRAPSGEGTSSLTTAGMQMHTDFGLATAGTSNSGAGPSSAAVGFGEYQPVADMADVMFNSGSSSNNSMDHLFFHG